MAVGEGRLEVQAVSMSASGMVGSAFSATAAAFESPDRRAAVLALEPLYKELPDAILHTIVDGVEPAGPYLGNPEFPEEMLKALARFEKGERQATRDRQETWSTRQWSLVEKAILIIIGAVIGWVIKAWTG